MNESRNLQPATSEVDIRKCYVTLGQPEGFMKTTQKAVHPGYRRSILHFATFITLSDGFGASYHFGSRAYRSVVLFLIMSA